MASSLIYSKNVSQRSRRARREKIPICFWRRCVRRQKHPARSGVSQTRLRRVKAQSGANPPRQKGCSFLTTYLHSATAALAAAAASSV